MSGLRRLASAPAHAEYTLSWRDHEKLHLTRRLRIPGTLAAVCPHDAPLPLRVVVDEPMGRSKFGVLIAIQGGTRGP